TARYLGITPEEHRPTTVDALVQDVTARGRLTTGNLATKYLLEVLSSNGRGDLALGLVRRHEYPGRLYMLDRGATTIWERWEDATGGGMNSHNHPMYGTVGAWLYRHLAGLRLDDDAVGFSRIVIDPLVTTPVAHASLALNTVRGRAAVRWTRTGDEVTVHVVVPSGATAHIVPVGEIAQAGHHRYVFGVGTSNGSACMDRC
ncbi:MAG: alpha-L-rhamnosidase C-terminal domain-containing protein, partial [Propionicimonas sp.]|nr:alpha-L-rhamnosidase C-terminal domain-containing protein [Propionicimonas sp.]